VAIIDLGHVDQRLEWAEAHALRVAGLSNDWAASAMRTTTTPDKERGLHVFRAEVVGDPPVTIALALGDLLHQARAALDNLVGVLRGGATDESQFRIDSDPAVFDRDERRRLDGLPPWAVGAIRQVQPFPGNPWGHVGDQLLKLHRLAIIDRHRALLLSAALIDLDTTYAATSHPGKTEFHIREGGRVLTLEYPDDALVTPATGAQVIVPEELLRWPDRSWPAFPSAEDVAKSVLWAVRVTIDIARQAAESSQVTFTNAD
jgi:hypothetical protein